MKIKELFSSADKWTQGATARTADEIVVPYVSPAAVKFCLLGSILKCYPTRNREDAMGPILGKVQNEIKMNLMDFNDLPTTTFETVKALVEKLDI